MNRGRIDLNRSPGLNERATLGISLLISSLLHSCLRTTSFTLYSPQDAARPTIDLQPDLNGASIGSAPCDEVLQSRGLLYHILKAV